MPELPGPPEDLTDAEQRAWLAGAATVADLARQQFAVIAETYAPDDEPDADDDSCPECDGELVDAFGGRVCTDCGFQDDDQEDT